MDTNVMVKVFVVIGVLVVIYPFIKPIINSKERKKRMEVTHWKRVAAIEQKIASISGEILTIVKASKDECPVYDALQLTEGSLYVHYKVTYLMDGITYETWAVFNIHSRKEDLLFPLLDIDEDSPEE